MGIYDVNYGELGRQVLPPDKRGPFQNAWVKAFLSPMQWLADLWLTSYRTGSTAPQYLGSTTYNKGDRVIYKATVYESLAAGNLNNTPPNATWWKVVQDNFIGTFERIQYNGEVLVLTYALNKFFNTTFRQPNNLSDIYIQGVPRPISPFVVGGSESNSSVVFYNRSSEVVINSYSFTDYHNMIIWVPLAVYNALDTVPANREKIIRNFADKYIVAGITYTVQTY